MRGSSSTTRTDFIPGLIIHPFVRTPVPVVERSWTIVWRSPGPVAVMPSPRSPEQEPKHENPYQNSKREKTPLAALIHHFWCRSFLWRSLPHPARESRLVRHLAHG